ncbi:MAG: hypothetical protein AAFN41_11380, partial [Planctomycetota bacterium]
MKPARLRESHCHIEAHGRSLSMLDASTCTSKGDFLELLSSSRPGSNNLILGQAARPEGWNPPGWPSADEIDAATGGSLVAVWGFD